MGLVVALAVLGTLPVATVAQFAISGITPSHGRLTGGTAITVTGTNLNFAPSSFEFTGTSSGTVAVTSYANGPGDTIVGIMPSGFSTAEILSVEICDTTPTCVNRANVYTLVAAPVVTAVTRAFGPWVGATTVTISGNNFGPSAYHPVSATMAGVECVTATWIALGIECVTGPSAGSPPVAPVAGPVVVTIEGVTSVGAAPTWTYNPPPVVAGVSRIFGPAAGGLPSPLVVTGSNFGPSGDGLESISILGSTCASPTHVTAAQVTCVPGPAPTPDGGLSLVTVTIDGVDSLPTGPLFRYNPRPTTTAVSRSFGPSAGGTDLTITGTGFGTADLGQVAVTVNAVPCASSAWVSVTEVTCTTAVALPSTGPVLVSIDGIPSVGATPLFTYNAPPTVVALSRPFGPAAGGTPLTIIGTGFGQVDDGQVGDLVQFAPRQVICGAADITWVSSTVLTCVTDADDGTNTGNPVAVSVEIDGVFSLTVPLITWEYNPAPTVATVERLVPPTGAVATAYGPQTGGTLLELVGTSFGTSNVGQIDDISVAGVSCTLYSWVDENTALCTTAASAPTSGPILVTVDGEPSVGAAPEFFFLGPPEVTSLSRSFGPASGGQVVSISGTSFGWLASVPIAVSIGGSPCAPVTLVAGSPPGATTIQCITSASALSVGAAVPVVLDVDGLLSSTAANLYTYVDAPTVTAINRPGQAPSAFTFVPGGSTTQLTVAGTGFGLAPETQLVPASAVTFDSPPALSCANAAYVDAATITCDVTPPATPAAAYQVHVEVDGVGSTGGAPTLTVNVAPTVTGLSRPFGPASGGLDLTVSGTGFGGTDLGQLDNVFLDNVGQTAMCDTISFISDTELGCQLANVGAAVAADDVRVTVDGVSSAASGVTFEFLGPPTSTTIARSDGIGTPRPTNYGPASPAASQLISINGNNFGSADLGQIDVVAFDGTPCTGVAWVSNTQLTCQATRTASMVAVPVFITVDAIPQVADGAKQTFLAPPTVTGVASSFGTPTFGPASVTATLTIDGTNFGIGFDDGQADVTVNGLAVCTAITVTSSDDLTCATDPATPPSSGPVVVIIDGVPSVPDGSTPSYTFLGTPALTSLSKTFGHVDGGDTITINGLGFGPDSHANLRVRFTTTDTAETWVSGTEIEATTPARAAGTADVNVQVFGVENPVANRLPFVYVSDAALFSLSRTFGPTAGGQTVTLTGANFGPGNEGQVVDLQVGDPKTSCASLAYVSDTAIECVTAAVGGGSVASAIDLTMWVPPQVFSGLSYAYLDPPTVTALLPRAYGPYVGGTPLTIQGANFGASDEGQVNAVTVAGVPCATFNWLAVGEIFCSTAAVPLGDAPLTGDVLVTIDGVENTVTQVFTYNPPPTISSVSPDHSDPAAVETLAFVGSGFGAGPAGGADSVTIDGTPCTSFLIGGDTSLSCDFDFAGFPAGVYDAVVEIDGVPSAGFPFAIDSTTDVPVLDSPSAATTVPAAFDVTFTLTEDAKLGTLYLLLDHTGADPDAQVFLRSIFTPAGTHTVTLNGNALPLSVGVEDVVGTQALTDGDDYVLSVHYMDVYDNAEAVSVATPTLTYDATVPAISDFSFTAAATIPNNYIPVAYPFDLATEIEWSETGTDFGLGDVETSSNVAALVNAGGADPVFTFDTRVSEAGVVSLSVPVGAVADAAGNTNTFAVAVSACVGECCAGPAYGVRGVYDAAAASCACESGYYQTDSMVPLCDGRVSSVCFSGSPPPPSLSVVDPTGLVTYLSGPAGNAPSSVALGQLKITLSIPVATGRSTSSVAMGSGTACAYPGPYWTKSVRSTSCIDLYDLSVPLSLLTAAAGAGGCGVATATIVSELPEVLGGTLTRAASAIAGISAYYLYEVDLTATTVDTNALLFDKGPVVGLDVTTVAFVRVLMAVPADMEITYTALSVEANPNLDFQVVLLRWDVDLAAATVQWHTIIDWPYQIRDFDLVSAPEGVLGSVSGPLTAVPGITCNAALVGSPCEQKWSMSIVPEATCTVGGTYRLQVASTECLDPLSCLEVNQTIEIELEAPTFCVISHVVEEDIFEVTTTTYEDPGFKQRETVFGVNGNVWVHAHVVSDIPVESLGIVAVSFENALTASTAGDSDDGSDPSDDGNDDNGPPQADYTVISRTGSDVFFRVFLTPLSLPDLAAAADTTGVVFYRMSFTIDVNYADSSRRRIRSGAGDGASGSGGGGAATTSVTIGVELGRESEDGSHSGDGAGSGNWSAGPGAGEGGDEEAAALAKARIRRSMWIGLGAMAVLVIILVVLGAAEAWVWWMRRTDRVKAEEDLWTTTTAGAGSLSSSSPPPSLSTGSSRFDEAAIVSASDHVTGGGLRSRSSTASPRSSLSR